MVATLVKFMCSGLDPFWYCNHVLDDGVTTLFGAKLKCEGYEYFKAKVKDVKARFEELYPIDINVRRCLEMDIL